MHSLTDVIAPAALQASPLRRVDGFIDLTHADDDITIYGLECKKTGRFYVGQTEDITARVKGHANKPPSMLAKDLDPFVKIKGGQTRVQWFRDQVVVHVLGTAAKGRAAHDMEGHFIKEKGGTYNIVKMGAPGKCRQGYAIMASKKRARAAMRRM
jgi:hypothetical protein